MWKRADEELPKAGVTVLMRYTNELGKARTMIGHWQDRMTIEAGPDCHEALETEYCEESDRVFEPGGWYEHSQWHPDWEYWHIGDTLKITHWHPIPPMDEQP